MLLESITGAHLRLHLMWKIDACSKLLLLIFHFRGARKLLEGVSLLDDALKTALHFTLT